MKKIKVLSLFDGISCAQVALKSLGYEVEYYASEIDKYAIEVTKKNHPDTIHIGDVKEVTKETIGGGVDLLIGGSPCQDLSIAKTNREGLAGKRSGLFYEYLRILHEVKPKYFVLENVASMPKEARETISKELGVEPIMINAALVSAQSRKRYFWTNIPSVALPKDQGILLKDILQKDVDEKYFLSEESLNAILEKMRQGRALPQSQRIYNAEGKSVTLSAGGGGLGAKTGLYVIVPEATKKGYAIAHEGDSIDLSFPGSKTRSRVGNKAKTLMTSANIYTLQNARVRKLTPIECCRLQGLVDEYTIGESDGKQYKALGNAFNVEVVKHILGHIKK